MPFTNDFGRSSSVVDGGRRANMPFPFQGNVFDFPKPWLVFDCGIDDGIDYCISTTLRMFKLRRGYEVVPIHLLFLSLHCVQFGYLKRTAKLGAVDPLRRTNQVDLNEIKNIGKLRCK